MDREGYNEARKVLEEIQHELATAPLTLQQRNELELHAAKLAGTLLHPWFPVSWGRRLLMAAIILFGLQQAWTGNYEPLIFWLLLPFFSPRIVGECAFLLGRVRRSVGGDRRDGGVGIGRKGFGEEGVASHHDRRNRERGSSNSRLSPPSTTRTDTSSSPMYFPALALASTP